MNNYFDKPGVLCVFCQQHLESFLRSSFLIRIRDLSIGDVVLHEGILRNGPRRPYDYSDPETVTEVIDILQAAGIRVTCYVHPALARDHWGYDIYCLCQQLRDKWGTDGVYFDGLPGVDLFDTWDVLERLHYVGFSPVMIHDSVRGTRYVPPYMQYPIVTHRLWGEQGPPYNPEPESLTDSLWDWMSLAHRGVISMYNPKNTKWMWPGGDPRWAALLPKKRMVLWGSQGYNLDTLYEDYFFPAFERLKGEIA